MISKIFFLFLVILLSLVGFVAYENPQVVEFTIIRGTTFHVSLTVLVLFAFCLGALIVLIVSFIRDMNRGLRLRKERKVQKREMEKLSAYAVILERLMWGNVKDIEDRLNNISKDFKEKGRFLRVKAELYKKREQWDKAYQAISQLRLSEESPKISTMMEEARLAKAAGLEDKALIAYKEILSINSIYLPALQGIRETLEEQEKWEEIIPIQERIIKASTNKEEEKKRLVIYRYKLAQQLIVASNEEIAIKGAELAKSLIRKDPKNSSLSVLLGNYYRLAGKTKEAIKVWEKAFSKTRNVYFLTLLETLLLDEGKSEEMLKHYSKAYKENPENLAIAFYFTRFALKNGKVEEARKVIDSLSEKAWDYPFMGLLKAAVLAGEGQKEEAFDTCEGVVKEEGWLEIPFVCHKCGHRVATWRDTCPNCGEIDAISFDLT